MARHRWCASAVTSLPDYYPVALDLQAALREELDRLGIRDALLLEDAVGQGVGRVVVQDGAASAGR